MPGLQVSVITASLNAAAHIETAIGSVAAQTYPRTEHVLIDGGSTDATLEVIERNRNSIGYFVSEPDHGIYDAMNKGIKAASGDILYFLNADDRFCDDRVVEDVVSVFERAPSVEVVYGNLVWDRRDGMERETQPSIVTRASLARGTILHQTVFARRHVFEATNGFSEHYRVVSDYEWMLKVFIRDQRNYQYIDRDIAVMGTEGLSWTSAEWESERIDAMRPYFTWYEMLRYRILPHNMEPVARTLYNIRRFLYLGRTNDCGVAESAPDPPSAVPTQPPSPRHE
jgi:glycosyltransferase involved in cell wall biosynthesis